MACRAALLLVVFAAGTLAPGAPQAEHAVYVPLILATGSGRLPGHGVAWARDVSPALGAEWVYHRNCRTDLLCVVMLDDWQTPQTCAPTLMLGNEPEGKFQPPAWASERSAEIREACPGSYLIAGNTVAPDSLWLDEYLAEGGQADALGVHCYATGADDCRARLLDFQARFSGWPMCLTEWNYLAKSLNPEAFAAYLDFILAHFACSAVFTEKYLLPWWSWEPMYWLVEADGALNAHGLIFADRRQQ